MCGNVVLLQDKKPDTPDSEGKYIELNPALWTPTPAQPPTPYGNAGQEEPAPVPAAAAAHPRGGSGPDEPMAEPPAPFEYPFED